MSDEFPLGQPLDWRPVPLPNAENCEGRYMRLEALDPERHGAALYAAACSGDPHLWDYMAYGPFADAQAFGEWLQRQAASSDPLFFALIDKHSGCACGMAAYLRITPEHGVIEIGHIWFGASLQRSTAATEAIYLLARRAFELGYRRLEWKCDALNRRSRRAAERFGFCFEGVFRQHLVVKGRNRDTAWFAMLDCDWPQRQATFEAWLQAVAQSADGRQPQTLAELRGTLTAQD